MILTKEDFKIGQEVACRYAGNLARGNKGYTIGTVTKVGRKLVTVSLGGNKGVQFEFEDNIERDYLLQKSNYGDYELFPSVQAYFEHEEKNKKASEIKLIFSSYSGVKLSVDQVRRIYDIVTE